MLLKNIILKQLLAVPAGTEFDLRNTSFSKILGANPSLSGFCGVQSDLQSDLLAANSSESIDLGIKSDNFFNSDQPFQNPKTNSQQKGANTMTVNASTRACTHIKVDGVQCGSPALREEVFCYFHQRMIRGVRTPPKSRLHPIALLEDEESIQASLMEMVNALVRNQIDVQRARLIMRALYIAARNAGQVHFGLRTSRMVSAIPEYPKAPESTGPFRDALAQAAALTTIGQPQEEETEIERLSTLVYPRPDDPKNRKPPIGAKEKEMVPRSRAATRRAG